MIHDQPLTLLRTTRDRLLPLYDTPELDLAKSYAPGKWTVRQILVHLADCEFVYLWRLCRGLAEPGSEVHGFDQDAWQEALHYAERPLPMCRDLFLVARSQVIYFAETMPETAVERTIRHSEAGTMSVGRVLEYLAVHTQHHLEQIDAALDGRVWKPTE
ncbi:MAG: hypothetical protein AMXMBFR4_32130 [Candidatus Hydrogenedentota bacterium]